MKMKCPACGAEDEVEMREGVCRCAYCGTILENAYREPAQNAAAKDAVAADAACPICGNKDNNTLKDGKCRCALCGTLFTPKETVRSTAYQPQNPFGTGFDDQQRREELKKKQNTNLLLGIIFLIVFWPVSIYFFWQYYKISKEL